MKKTNIIISTILYNSFEYYQNILYGVFSFILASRFFPADNINISIFVSLATFAAGFLANPFGGLVFGYFGDKYGRKSTIILAILLTSLPTFLIGILPTYAQIGILSSFILIVCRLLQGFAVGGQAYGRIVFIVEHAFKNRVNLACSVLASSSLLGALLGTVIGTLCMLEMMPEWAWRIPFIVGGLLGLISYFIMREVEETDEHKNAQKENILERRPIIEIFQKHLNNFVCVISISGATLIPFYIISIYMIGRVFSSNFNFSASYIMLIVSCFMGVWAILLPLMGYLSDKVGGERVMEVSSLGMLLFSFPLCWLIQQSDSLFLAFLGLIVLSGLSAGYVAPSGTLMTKLFPVSVRCSGVSVASGIGTALFGGTAPLIGSLLVESTGKLSSSAFYIMFGSLMGYIALKKAVRGEQPLIKKPKSSSPDNLIATLNKQGYMLTSLHEYSKAFVEFSAIAPGPVLDIGAAYGVASILALKKGAHVIANDIDNRHLEILRKITPKSCLKNLELKIGKIPGEVSFSENSLGAVLASGVLHFLSGEDLVKSIDQIYKWLKPGGKLFFASTTPYAKLYQDFLPLYLERKKAGQKWPGFIENTVQYAPQIAHEIPKAINLLDIDILETCLLEAGFHIEKIGLFNISDNDSINIGGNSVLGAIALK
jgi:MHS family proline/betaine transporter-like MFS transporter